MFKSALRVLKFVVLIRNERFMLFYMVQVLENYHVYLRLSQLTLFFNIIELPLRYNPGVVEKFKKSEKRI